MQRVNSGSPVVGPIIAAAIEVVVANEANPTPELSLLGTAVPDWVMTVTDTAGTDEATLYRLDATTDPANPPYTVASATAGLLWVAIAGRYVNQSIGTFDSLFAQGFITAQATVTGVGGVVSGTGFSGGPGAAGPFQGGLVLSRTAPDDPFILFQTGGISYVQIRATSGVEQLRVTGLAGTPDFMRVAYARTAVLGTVAAASSITGQFVVGDQTTAATNVSIGGGIVYAGTAVVSIGTIFAGGTVTGDAFICTANSAAVQSALFHHTAFGLTLWAASGSSTDFAVLDAGGAYALQMLTGTRNFRMLGTTAASGSLVGSLVVGDGVTSATNVSIGQGILVTGAAIFAGGTISALGGSAASVAAPSLALLNNRIISWQDNAAGYTNSAFLWYDTTNTLNIGARNATQVHIASGAVTSTVAGAVVIGDGTTAPFNIAMGQGQIWAGGNITSGTGAATTNYIVVDGISSGASGGAAFVVKVGGTNSLGLGNYSALNGGAFNGVPILKVGPSGTGQMLLYGAMRVENSTAATSSITGAIIIGDGVTAATNIGMGGGVIYAGHAVTGFWSIAPGYAFWQNNNLPVTVGNYALLQATDGTTAVNVPTTAVGSLRSNNSAVFEWATAKVRVALTAAATSTISGPFVVGDGVTAATNVSIGGGSIWMGQQLNGNPGAATNFEIVNRSTGGLALYSNTGAGGVNLTINAAGSVIVGSAAALATTATNGFLYLTTCAGTPTGVPVAQTGKAPLQIDATNNKLYSYIGGAWRTSATTAFYARIADDTVIPVVAPAAMTNDRVMFITNAASATYTMPVAPAVGVVVAIGTGDFATVGSAQATLDAGVGVKIAGRTRFLVLTHENFVLLRWSGTQWTALVLDLDSPWMSAGTVTIGATTLAPVKGTTTRDQVWWSRKGSDLLVRYEYRQTAVGAATNGTGDYLFTMPFSADTAVAFATTALNNFDMFTSGVGDARYLRGADSVVGSASLYDATRFRISGIHLASPVAGTDNAPVNAAIGLNNANVAFAASIRVPIVNW